MANGKGRLPLGAETTFTLLSSNLRIELADASVSLITGYAKTEQDFLLDFFDGRAAPLISFGVDPVTGLPTRFNVSNNIIADRPVQGFAVGGFNIANISVAEQVTQELKVNGSMLGDRLDYVTGLFFFNERNKTDFADTFTLGPTAGLLLADRILRNDTRAYAAYVQADYQLSPTWVATAGVRFTSERKDFDFSDNRPQCQVLPLPANCIDSRNFASVVLNPELPPVAIPLEQKTDIWTPRFALSYAPVESVMLFASATRGFKSGSQSGRATAVSNLLPFGPEIVWSYELGAKTEWFDRRLRVNATAFWQDNKDFQGGSAFVNPATGALQFVTRNLGALENRGLELEILARPIDPLTISFAAGIQSIKYKIDPSEPARNEFNILSVAAQQAECLAALSGAASPIGDLRPAVTRAQQSCAGIVSTDGSLAKPVRSPSTSLMLGVAYDFPVPTLKMTLTPSLNVRYTSDTEVGTNNLSIFRSASGQLNFARDGDFVLGSFSEAHTVVNASVTLRTDDDAWFASLGCSNCSDTAFPQSTLSNYTYLNPPRTWSLRVRRNF